MPLPTQPCVGDVWIDRGGREHTILPTVGNLLSGSRTVLRGEQRCPIIGYAGHEGYRVYDHTTATYPIHLIRRVRETTNPWWNLMDFGTKQFLYRRLMIEIMFSQRFMCFAFSVQIPRTHVWYQATIKAINALDIASNRTIKSNLHNGYKSLMVTFNDMEQDLTEYMVDPTENNVWRDEAYARAEAKRIADIAVDTHTALGGFMRTPQRAKGLPDLMGEVCPT